MDLVLSSILWVVQLCSEALVVGYALLSTGCLLCQMEQKLTDFLATGASQPLNLAVHRCALSHNALNFHGALLEKA